MSELEELQALNRAIWQEFGYMFATIRYGNQWALKFDGEYESYTVTFGELKRYVLYWNGPEEWLHGSTNFYTAEELIKMLDNVRLPRIKVLK